MELKRCPFCGGKAEMQSWEMSPYEKINIEHVDGKWYSVYCKECCSSGSDCITENDAANAWNRRAGE